MATYKIVRFYQRGFRETINTGLTLEEAQDHCRTAVRPEALAIYEKNGPWFDGYEKEHD